MWTVFELDSRKGNRRIRVDMTFQKIWPDPIPPF